MGKAAAKGSAAIAEEQPDALSVVGPGQQARTEKRPEAGRAESSAHVRDPADRRSPRRVRLGPGVFGHAAPEAHRFGATDAALNRLG